MILKHYDILKKNIADKIILFYGKNEGHKNQIINNLLKTTKEIFKYEEKEILVNSDAFIDKILTKSLFEKKKIILINRASDKIIRIIENIDDKEINDVSILINSETLEKKSKLRSYFEKSKKHICVAFYPDNERTLFKLTLEFLKKKEIKLSTLNINLIIDKCNGDRQNLFNELKKIESLSLTEKNLNTENISKLINLSENHSISSLIDNCLVKNKRKIINILNENNFNNEDCIQIIRIFLNKSKKILLLANDYKNNNNIDLTISSAKPPIFWKDKEIVKQQILSWSPKNIKKLIYELSELELQIKKNINNSINLIVDFLLDQSSKKTNN